jgi:predicted phage tail protein
MLRKIKIYGSLAKFLKRRVFHADVANPAEAVRFLLANFPVLRSHMSDQYYKVLVSDRALDIGDEPEQLHHPIGAEEEIKIVPVMAGAGGGVGKILAGVGLIAAAIILGPAAGGFLGLGAGLGGATGAGAAISLGLIGGAAATAIGAIGAALVLGGVAQLISPVPQLGVGNVGETFSNQDPRKSYNFSGIQNVSRQGVPVPIVYGETIVGSVTVSAAILTDDPEAAAY